MGDRLIFTDPNGTRPYTAETIADLWQTALPTRFADLPGKGHFQRESFVQWAQDHNKFKNDPEAFIPTGGKDYWEDFQRTLARLKPSGREKEGMFRGLAFKDSKTLGDFLATLELDGYGVRKEFPAESWSGSLAAAKKYAGAKDYKVILRLPAGHSAARDVSALTRAFAKQIRTGEVPQGKLSLTDNEILIPQSAKFRVKSIRRTQETGAGKTMEIILEEAR